MRIYRIIADNTFLENTIFTTWETPKREEECFGSKQRNLFDLVSFGLFLLAVGVIFILNPDIFSQLSSWVGTLVSEKALVRPATEIIESASLFFLISGISNFFMAAIKTIFEKVGRRIFADVLSGVGLTIFAYLLNLFGNRAISGQMTLGIEIMVIGVLLIVYSILRHYLKH